MNTLADEMNINPVFCKHIPQELKDAVLYISDEFRTAIHLCPFNCKTEVITPLDYGRWKVSQNVQKTVISLSPSVLCPNCGEHYCITDNIILKSQ